MLGNLKNGTPVSPLFAAFGPEPIATRLNLGSGTVLVTTTLYLKKVARIRDQVPSLRHVLVVPDDPDEPLPAGTSDLPALLAAASDDFTVVATRPDDLALLHFTSGTTGAPKGAMHVHEAALTHWVTGRYALDLHPQDTFWCTADPTSAPALTGVGWPLFREAPSLSQRAPVERGVHTGVMVIDAAIPIGRGQRQLIVGDRNVGKTSLALDIVAAQHPGDVCCVYVLVGQPMSRMLSVRESLLDSGALANTVIVAADAAESPGLQYLAPYAGASIAEFFAEQQARDALVVYDALTKHADSYRELALLLGRAPGREAFPGDIFHIHAQLLERATARNAALGGGSVTAFPIVETTDGDISAYIPTNLISITDGQLYLDTVRFERNLRPAIDIGRSVSRVGGAAQSPPMRTAAQNLRITMSRFEALESLTRVGLDVDPTTCAAVERGLLVRELLRQPRFTPRSIAHQILALTAAGAG